MCVMIRGGTKNIGTGTGGTSISSGRVSLCRFGVVGGECGDVRVLHTVCQVGGQHAGAGPVKVKAIISKKMSPLPKDIKIVNEADVVGTAGRGEPGVQAEQPAETPNAPATGGGGAGDKNTQLGL